VAGKPRRSVVDYVNVTGDYVSVPGTIDVAIGRLWIISVDSIESDDVYILRLEMYKPCLGGRIRKKYGML
jgi:hypothetical protein